MIIVNGWLPPQLRFLIPQEDLRKDLGWNKVSNQQWFAYLDLDYPDCLNIFASRNKNLKRDRSVQQTAWIKQDGGFFVDYLQPLTPCWKNLIKKIQKQGKTSGKWMTCSFLWCLRNIRNSQKCCSSEGCLRRAKKLIAFYGLNLANFHLLRLILNIQVQLL